MPGISIITVVKCMPDILRKIMADMSGSGVEPDDSPDIQMRWKALALLDWLAKYKSLAKVEEIVERDAKSRNAEKAKKPSCMGIDD